MLPLGLTAQPVGPAQAAAARALLPTVQTVAELLVGACSCDLVRPRNPEPREDERHLRARFARLGLPREEIIRRLERHRRRPAPASGTAGPSSLAGFVAEHARNAGPTLYVLRFGDEAGPLVTPVTPCLVSRVRETPDTWLEEGRPLLVIRQQPFR
jgi:hypothetical protein